MTGPEHFGAAERLLKPRVSQIAVGSPGNPAFVPGSLEPPSDRDVAAAQVHATLALAAVTAAAELSLTSLGKDRPIEAWREVIL